jgi:hypothetical protein
MEKNYRSFEDRERTVVKIKSIFSNTFYLRTAAFDYPKLLHFHDFIDLLSLSSYLGVSLVYFMWIWVAPFTLLMSFRLFLKKKYYSLLLCSRLYVFTMHIFEF